MHLVDYHTHSGYSFDGRESLTDMCKAALAAGLKELAVTDHLDIYTGLPYGRMLSFEEDNIAFEEEDILVENKESADGNIKDILAKITETAMHTPYFREPEKWVRPILSKGHAIEMDVAGLYRELEEVKRRYEGRLKVLAGSELGQPMMNPGAAKAFLKEVPLDFVIGSIHNMACDLDPYYFNYDYVDIPRMYDAYVDSLIDMARNGDFDICGHLTYPLRYAYEYSGLTLDLSPYEEKFRTLFKLLIEKGRGIEINLSGYYKSMKGPMPTPELVKLYRECGGELITLGSDAHQKQYIGSYLKEGYEILKYAGFRYLTVYECRKPSFVKIDG